MALMHLYHGDGKGKTTAALGLALRAAGAGYRVVLAQFFKTMPSSELKSLAQIPQVTVIRGKRDFGFTWTLSEAEQAELRHEYLAEYRENMKAILDGIVIQEKDGSRHQLTQKDHSPVQ